MEQTINDISDINNKLINDTGANGASVYFTGNPDITFNKNVYHRHAQFGTHFASYDSTNANYSSAFSIDEVQNSISFDCKKAGMFTNYHDLLSEIWLSLNDKKVNIQTLLNDIKITITFTDENETENETNSLSYENYPEFDTLHKINIMKNNIYKIFTSYANPIPLIAIPNHNILITIQFNKLSCKTYSNLKLHFGITELDIEERRKFIQSGHESLYVQKNKVLHNHNLNTHVDNQNLNITIYDYYEYYDNWIIVYSTKSWWCGNRYDILY
jgi:hypothetical protein